MVGAILSGRQYMGMNSSHGSVVKIQHSSEFLFGVNPVSQPKFKPWGPVTPCHKRVPCARFRSPGWGSIGNGGAGLFGGTPLASIPFSVRYPAGAAARTYLAIRSGSHNEMLPSERHPRCHLPIAWAIVATGNITPYPAPCIITAAACVVVRERANDFCRSTYTNIPRSRVLIAVVNARVVTKAQTTHQHPVSLYKVIPRSIRAIKCGGEVFWDPQEWDMSRTDIIH